MPILVVKTFFFKRTIRFYKRKLCKRQVTSSVGKGVEKWEPSHIAGGNVK